jgi:hypothetical protein
MATLNNLTVNTQIIDLPFNLSTYGKVASISSNDAKVRRNKIASLFSVEVNERVWYRYYGASLNNIFYENGNSAGALAKETIKETFIKWAPELTFMDVISEFDQSTGTVSLNILYQIPTGEVESAKITTETLTASGETIKGV